VRIDPGARAYDTVAETYDAARPSYPAEAISLLSKELDIGPGKLVVDLGAGTGKLTAHLVETGARIIAIEPLAAMRAALQERLPVVIALEGTAEAMPLESSSVDVVLSAQAWHWFDGTTALRECARVLRNGGGLGLLWNEYDLTVPWIRRFADVYRRRMPAGRGELGEARWRAAFENTDRWAPLEHRHVPNLHRTSRSGVIGRALSSSWIAALDEAGRSEVVQEVEEVLEGDSATRGRDFLDLQYVTDVYWTRRVPV
jgi:SAM-dependent methyltransferase